MRTARMYSYFLLGQFEDADASFTAKSIILTACVQKSRKSDFQLKWREIRVNIVVIFAFLTL
jgi:hypothetical protein